MEKTIILEILALSALSTLSFGATNNATPVTEPLRSSMKDGAMMSNRTKTNQ